MDSCRCYVAALEAALQGAPPGEVFQAALARAGSEVAAILREAEARPPGDFLTSQGWVRLALHNAFHRLLHAGSLEEGLVETVRQGGDTDTNGAIAGALLGAVHGREAIPWQWRQAILTCRPHRAYAGTRHPRPRWLWPVDALDLAEALAAGG